MAGILYAIWRDGSTYEATRGAKDIDVTEDVDLSNVVPLAQTKKQRRVSRRAKR
jgi:hypothetical protein